MLNAELTLRLYGRVFVICFCPIAATGKNRPRNARLGSRAEQYCRMHDSGGKISGSFYTLNRKSMMSPSLTT
jgi:hypothetical protein